jgi:amidase
LLEDLGHDVQEADPDYPNVRSLAVPRYLAGIAADAMLLDDPARLEHRTKTLVRLGRLISKRRVERARRREADYTSRINRLFDRYDVLLTPVVARPAPLTSRYCERGAIANLVGNVPWIAFTQVWNVTGQPALSLPIGYDSDGMPLAVQLIAPLNGEAVLLTLAAQIETAAPNPRRFPTLG